MSCSYDNKCVHCLELKLSTLSCVLLCSQIHEQRLKAKGYYTDVEIRRAVREVHGYKKLHQDKPGFFDTAINTGTHPPTFMFMFGKLVVSLPDQFTIACSGLGMRLVGYYTLALSCMSEHSLVLRHSKNRRTGYKAI